MSFISFESKICPSIFHLFEIENKRLKTETGASSIEQGSLKGECHDIAMIYVEYGDVVNIR